MSHWIPLSPTTSWCEYTTTKGREEALLRKSVKSCPVCVAMFHGTCYSNCSQQLQVALRVWWWCWWWWPSSHIPSCSSVNITFRLASIYSVPFLLLPKLHTCFLFSSIDTEPLSEIHWQFFVSNNWNWDFIVFWKTVLTFSTMIYTLFM